MTQGLRHRLAHLTLRHRFVSLGIILALTAFFAAGLPRVELRTIFSDLFPKNHPFVQTYKDHPNFGNPLTITIMVKRKNGDIYNAETLAKVWRMTRDIDLAPAVDHDQVLSITTEKARYAEATPYGIDIRPVMEDTAPETEEEIEEFKRRVDKSTNIRTFLISQDESATLIQATFIERLLDYGETFRFVQDIVERERDDDHEIHAAGQPMLTGWVYTYEIQMIGIFAVTLTMLLVALIVYMRNFLGVVTPLLVSLVAAIWGFGFVGWIGDPIEPLILVVPLLLIARSFSHTVQFIERYYEIYCEVPERKAAAELTLGVMMAPGVLGIITDAAGLFLIAIAPIPVMERFALFCGFWAAILVPANLFLAPVLLTFFPAPRNASMLAGKSHHKSAHARLIRMLEKVGSLNHGPPGRRTTAVVVVVSAVAFALMSQIKIGNPVEGSNLLRRDDP
jgi:predicted RND superfamily exporter protein